MSLTTEEKQELLTNLEKAYYEGVLEVEYNDKRVRYRSKKEMREIMDDLKKSLGQGKKTNKCFANFSKGTC